MALPHVPITPIPDTEPDAVPALWNARYEEIDNNFSDLDGRLESAETEVADARGLESTLGDRLNTMAGLIAGLDPDMQNALLANIAAAVDAAGLANREIERSKTVRHQEGEVLVLNRGCCSGCEASKSSTATRNLHLAAGVAFMSGRKFGVLGQDNSAVVPSNPGSHAGVSLAYLYLDGSGFVRMDCTDLDAPVPADGIEVAMVDVPAGSTESTDPDLSLCTLTDTRRVEPHWPIAQQSPAYVDVPLQRVLPDTEYAVAYEVLSCDGGRLQLGEVFVDSRLTNGFRLYVAGGSDTVRVRYIVQRINI